MESLLVFSTLAFTLIFNLIFIPVVLRISHKFKWYDLPDKRKIHKSLVPRIGGVGIFFSFLVGLLLTPPILSLIVGQELPNFFSTAYIPFFTGCILVHLVGLIDDFYNLKATIKFIVHIVAASIVAIGGFTIKTISIPYLGTISLGIFGYPITIFWVVGIINAINLVDGMDGLSGGISAFAALSMGIISLIQGQILSAMVAFSLFGSIIGFLKYNFPPAKIFMGDSGSYFLGFCLAVIPLMGISKTASLATLLFPITILLVPIIDTLGAIIRRIANKRSIGSPDQEHIHHKLLGLGLSERKILLLIYIICCYLSIVAITSVILPKEINVYLILIVWVGSMLGYGIINILSSKKKAINQKYNNEQKNKTSVL